MSPQRSVVDQERLALLRVESAARAYAAITHGNLSGEAYHRRDEARDRLLDALSSLDVIRHSPSVLSGIAIQRVRV